MSVSGVEDSTPTAAYNLIPEDTLLAVFHAAEFGDLKALQDLFQQNLPPTQLINKVCSSLHCTSLPS
jgi:ribonuclease D